MKLFLCLTPHPVPNRSSRRRREAWENDSPLGKLFFFSCFFTRPRHKHTHTLADCNCAQSCGERERKGKSLVFAASHVDDARLTMLFADRFFHQTFGVALPDCYIVVPPRLMYIYNLIVRSFQNLYFSLFVFHLSWLLGTANNEMQNDSCKDYKGTPKAESENYV